MRVRLSPWLLHVVITVHWSLHSVEFFPALALSRRNAKVLSPAFLQAEHVLQVRFFWQAVSWSGWAEGDLLGAARWPEGLESSPPLVPVPQFPVEGVALAGCLPPGREVQPVPCSTCDPSFSPPSPSPIPSCKEIHTAWGLSQVAALFCSASGCLPRRRRLQGLGLAAGDSHGAHPQGLHFPQTVDGGLALLLLGRFKPRIHA